MNWSGRMSILETILKDMARSLKDLAARMARAEANIQQRGGGSGGGGGGAPHMYLALSDGAAACTGAFPHSLTPGTFTSDVLDIVTGDVLAGESVEWWNTDALSVAGALVWCDKKPDGSFVGKIEQCSPVDEDEE